MKNSKPASSNDDAEILHLIEQDQGSEKQTVVISHEFRDIEEHAPADLLAQLTASGDLLEQMSWKIGWLTDKLYRVLEANGRPKNYMLVCYYVAMSSLRGQRSFNTVKKWALTARFYEPKVARQFHSDVLPFNHFTYAAGFGNEDHSDTKRPMWQEVLLYSWDTYQDSGIGKACSVEELRRVFENKPAKPKTGTARYTPATPLPAYGGLALAEAIDNPDDDDDDVTVVAKLTSALHVVKGTLPFIQKRFPVAAQVIAGISVQLDKVAARLQLGLDVEAR